MTDRDRLGRAAAHYAAADGDADGLRVLLAGGAAAEAADDAGWTPLHFAAQAQAPSAIEVLLAAGAPVDAADGHGNTPLWRAVFCSQGEGATIRLLLEAGADPDRGNVHGVSPRALAGRIANYDVAAHFPARDGTSS
ncbi:ankyrin repeat domain-containing protein [Streptomyces misionensis]|uniref:ankyrin repeat domain-containing protein n=1 Tax=Streptomyces misionensis TaxID=67331 RepID=UPI001ABF65D6|nr:ankyrin repeat domain-containing protein [Streptomyces misionensis]